MSLSDFGKNISFNKNRLKTSFIIGAIACLPVTGFIYGFIICSDCGNGLQSVPGRSFLGIIYSFFTLITIGKPWTNGGAVMTSTNLRPYVLLTLIIVATLTYILLLKRNKKNGEQGTF
mgnify:CR=1 FL=1|tara:strand:- start:1204 stop:1557 length:354 start_codon:yes stop_codon:yes gene_type:complete